MNIKISQTPTGGWSLWATEKPGDDQPMIHAAAKRTVAQIQALLTVLLDEADASPTAPKGSDLAAIKTSTLAAVLAALDGWIEGSRDNHVEVGHRHENVGDECWRKFGPADIRNMINDAALEVGVNQFPIPIIPKEDA